MLLHAIKCKSVHNEISQKILQTLQHKYLSTYKQFMSSSDTKKFKINKISLKLNSK